MKKKLADEIGKTYIRLHCPHWEWRLTTITDGDKYGRGIIICKKCGKIKLIEALKEYEILD